MVGEREGRTGDILTSNSELQATKELVQQKDSSMEEKQNHLAKLQQLVKAKDTKLAKLAELVCRGGKKGEGEKSSMQESKTT